MVVAGRGLRLSLTRVNGEEPFVIHDPAFDGVVLCNLIYPFTKLYCTLRIDLKPYGDYHFQGIMIGAVTLSVSGSYSKFSNN